MRERAMVTCHLAGQKRALALELAGVLKLSRGFLRSDRRYWQQFRSLKGSIHFLALNVRVKSEVVRRLLRVALV